ncbi:jhy protein homolog isoform X3 [Anomalospiza imberbis]|uniref:jhy protein homolog isoform X3 n=1 Tax=Anomalospiza imberbis TaxID=187417 RepID=UPI00358E5CD9
MGPGPNGGDRDGTRDRDTGTAGWCEPSVQNGMNPSNMKYISVSSPHTYTTNNIEVPPKILVPPVFQPASWERERSSASSLEDSQDSDSESLEKERQYQLALQQRILENQELVRQDAGDILEDDIVEEDSLEEMSSEEKGAEYDTKKKGKPKIYGNGRKKLPVDKYSSLRYNPHWKSAKKGADFFEAEKASQIFGGSSGDFSLDSFYLHSDGSSENNQQEAKTQDSLPGFGPELFSFYGANVASNKPVGPQAKRKEPADGFHSKDNPGHAFPPQNQQDPPQRAKKNFVKKNKRTLGLQLQKINSYLELHNKKQQFLQEQVDPTPVDEEPLQNVPAFQTGKMKPEDKWHSKGQQLKNFYPAEVLNPECASKEDKKYQHDSPAGIPHHFPANAIPGQHFSRNNSNSGQAHPELGNISSDFNAIFQERVKDQAPLPDFKNHIHEDNSSPTAACRISRFRETKEQHQPRISDFDDFAGTWLWGLFPPALPQVQRGSQGGSGSAEGNPRKMRRSSSEGSLLQREKQNQPKASKKLGSSKFYFNLSMKLGGLGPDYETIKEKKEKLKLQKEYSRQIKEYNMKNITVVQRFLPAKPQVSSGSRQKALEYAKKIPRPRTFIARQSEQEVKEALPQAPAGTRFPKIPSLESLWSRHEREKEVVAAFEALHLL